MKQLQKQAFELLKNKSGNTPLIIKAIEEFSEMQQVLARYLNKDVADGSHMDIDRFDIMEEVADVQIVTDFIIKIFDFNQHNIDMIKRDKLDKVIKNNS